MSVSLDELDAFIALDYTRSAMCCSSLDLHDLLSKLCCQTVFSESMSLNNFKEIIWTPQSDDKSNRSNRLRNDQFALVSELWSHFVKNRQLCLIEM